MPDPLIVRAEAAVHAALDLEEAGDLSGALAAYLRAQRALAFVPDATLDSETFNYSPERIAAAIADLRRQINSIGGAQIVERPQQPTRG